MLASGTWFLLEGRTNAYLINQSEKANAYIYVTVILENQGVKKITSQFRN